MTQPSATRLITGTFLGIDHWSDQEGARFQQEIRRLGEAGWQRMVQDMHGIGIDTQLRLTAPYVDKQVMYQYPGLMCHPDHPIHVGGERAVTLYETYVHDREQIRDGRLP